MNPAHRIGKRYFFGIFSFNAVGIIAVISVLGISIGTAALILVSSVFNGFEGLIKGLYSSFQPDIMVKPAEGKVFVPTEEMFAKLDGIEEVEFVAQSLEEIAFFEYKGGQHFGTIKGVDENWLDVSRLDSVIYTGEYRLSKGNLDYGIVGYGMRRKLGISIEDYLTDLSVYMLKKKASPFEKPFKTQYIKPAGIFMIQQQFDERYVISSLDFAQRLRSYKGGEVSQIEIRLKEGVDHESAMNKIAGVLGPEFTVKDRFRQNEAFFKLMQVEKWMGFAITGLVLLLVVVNMVGCMLMVVHEKKKDIAILKSMGADSGMIRRIFMTVGLWMSGVGIALGFTLALLIYFLQKTIGIIRMEGFIVDAYPIELQWTDFLVTLVFVFTFGILFSLFPANRAARIKSLVRND